MNSKVILSIILILIGAGILTYGHFSYRTRETVLEVGPIKATAEKTHDVPIPAILGWALIGGGAVVLVLSSRSKA